MVKINKAIEILLVCILSKQNKFYSLYSNIQKFKKKMLTLDKEELIHLVVGLMVTCVIFPVLCIVCGCLCSIRKKCCKNENENKNKNKNFNENSNKNFEFNP